jgi:hypothetical protein
VPDRWMIRRTEGNVDVSSQRHPTKLLRC